MRSRRRPAISALTAGCMVGFLLFPVVAVGQDADALIEEGVQLREQRQDEAALSRFEQAYEISGSARALAQIGLAEHALSRSAAAYRHLSEALRSGDPWVLERGAPLQRALTRMQRRVARLNVRGEPAGAEVFVDSESLGRIPLETAVEPGAHAIEVRAHGFTTFSGEIDIAAGDSFDQDVSLDASASDEATPSDSEPPTGDEGGGGGGEGIHPVGPIVLGVGGALLISGVITGVLTLDYESQANEMCPDPLRCAPAARGLVSDRDTFAIVTDVLLFTGGAAVAAGVLLTILVTEGGEEDVALVPSIGPTTQSVHLRGRF